MRDGEPVVLADDPSEGRYWTDGLGDAARWPTKWEAEINARFDYGVTNIRIVECQQEIVPILRRDVGTLPDRPAERPPMIDATALYARVALARLEKPLRFRGRDQA